MIKADGKSAKPTKIITSLVLNLAPNTPRRLSMKSLMRFLAKTKTRTSNIVRFTTVKPYRKTRARNPGEKDCDFPIR